VRSNARCAFVDAEVGRKVHLWGSVTPAAHRERSRPKTPRVQRGKIIVRGRHTVLEIFRHQLRVLAARFRDRHEADDQADCFSSFWTWFPLKRSKHRNRPRCGVSPSLFAILAPPRLPGTSTSRSGNGRAFEVLRISGIDLVEARRASSSASAPSSNRDPWESILRCGRAPIRIGQVSQAAIGVPADRHPQSGRFVIFCREMEEDGILD